MISNAILKVDRPRVGILGGGQLSLMLASAARRMGLNTTVLADNADSPAAQVFTQTVFGPASSAFFSQVDLVVFENEFIDCNQLAAATTNSKVRFLPGLETMARVQNKLKQKELLRELDLPTAPFVEVKNLEEMRDCFERLGGSFVLKWAYMGYDGKGVLPVRELSSAEVTKVEKFALEARKRQSVLFAEEMISFKRELSIIAVYSVNGEFLTYPLVISEQDRGICKRVHGPALAFGLDPKLEKQAREIAHKIAVTLKLVGSFAIEFFETQDGRLLVNEIAPRVHNSGHYTQNACAADQFENHWRAVLGLPLGRVHTAPGFAMLNILGPSEKTTAYKLPIPGPRSHLHWYGKKELSPGRKLGHVNGVVDSPAGVPSLLEELAAVDREWLNQFAASSSKREGE